MSPNEEVPELALDLGTYDRPNITNVGTASHLFDKGLRLLLAYQHEEAGKAFQECVRVSNDCALAHALIALAHSPNYNFNGVDFYEASREIQEFSKDKRLSQEVMYEYPSKFLASYHSQEAVKIVENLALKGRRRKNKKFHATQLSPISNVEAMIIRAVRTLNSNLNVDSSIAEKLNGRPFGNEMRKVYQKHPEDPEVAYFYAGSLMNLNAWNLYDYPTQTPLSNDVPKVKKVLEDSLLIHPNHVGLCHMYIHLCEMSPNPEKALNACDVLRERFPDAGHLLHMPTHIDVLVGDYEACVRSNEAAIVADKKAMRVSPSSTGVTSIYFGYVAHNYHMLVYGAILGAMEHKAFVFANELNQYLSESTFRENPHLAPCLESYATLDIHVLVRFGRWDRILELDLPKAPSVMVYRSASIRYARAISFANTGKIEAAREEARLFEEIRASPDSKNRFLHNNTISDLLEVDSYMIKGEIAFFDEKYDAAFKFLERSVNLDDNLNYDEPWGKMQPVRHALGGLLLKRGFAKKAEVVFREDLKRHPDNPWALNGLLSSLKEQRNRSIDENKKSKKLKKRHCCSHRHPASKKSMILSDSEQNFIQCEIKDLIQVIEEKKKCDLVDYDVTCSCACCLPKDYSYPRGKLNDEEIPKIRKEKGEKRAPEKSRNHTRMDILPFEM